MWPFSKSKSLTSAPRIFFYNTLTNSKDLFVPLKPHEVTMYSCGPTVYSKQHIGNLRTPLTADLVARMLKDAGYHVRRVINITDVGHLVGDTEEGEDKMAIGAKRDKSSPQDIAARYTKMYLDDLDELTVETREIQFPKATEYIKEQIALAKTLEEKGFTYRLPEGLYFDTSKFPQYGKLGNREGADIKEGARVAKIEGKRNPSDFVLWRAAKPNDLQQWDSPWGRGNPGWHLECSAMSRSLLGAQIDIHTGGEDLASIHHNDEIAQSEAANGRQFVRYWLHNAFLNIQGEKISKSLNNEIYLSDIIEKGFYPLSLRYFFLQGHYRTPLSFSFDALEGANEALTRLWRYTRELYEETRGKGKDSEVLEHFRIALRDDLSTPQALSILWESLKNDDISSEEKWGLIEGADALLGLSLISPPEETAALDINTLPADIRKKVEKREEARMEKDFATADALREEIIRGGYHVDDGPMGPILTRRDE